MGNQPNLIFDQLCNALEKAQEIIQEGTSSNLTMAFYDNYKRNNTKKPYKTQWGKKIQLIMENNPISTPKTTIILKVKNLKGAICFSPCHKMSILHYKSNKGNLQNKSKFYCTRHSKL
jgi:hypothetical protein